MQIKMGAVRSLKNVSSGENVARATPLKNNIIGTSNDKY